MSKFSSDPISNIEWRDASTLIANHYNPNVVFNQELKLLETSIMTNGWIQPILINKKGVIIDGFHRWRLTLESKKILSKYANKLPCAVLDVPEEEAMMLTIRINRAKGSHLGYKMADVVRDLVVNKGVSKERVAESIGAVKAEVDLLCQQSVFTKKDIKNYKYSKAWYPKEEKKVKKE